jgi:hypothetical protein
MATTHKRIPELESIEFTGAKSVAAYSRALRQLARDMSNETEFAAEELVAVLSRQKGHPLLAGIDTRMRARRVAKRLHRASELFIGAAIEAVKLNQEFRLQFADVIAPKPSRQPAKQFNFDDDDS